MPNQVRPNVLTGQRAQSQAKLLQKAVQFVTVKFVTVENEFWSSWCPHEALDLRCKFVVLGQLKLIVLDLQILRGRLCVWNEVRDRIPCGNQYDTIHR